MPRFRGITQIATIHIHGSIFGVRLCGFRVMALGFQSFGVSQVTWAKEAGLKFSEEV